MDSNGFHSGPGVLQHLNEAEDLPDEQFYPKLGVKVGKVVRYSLLARLILSLAISRGKIS